MKKTSLAKEKFNSLLLSATLTMIVTYLMLLSDTLIVGNIVGENGISAINIVMPMFSAANFVAGLIGMGTSYLYCRTMGEYQSERADGLFSQGVVLSLLSGIAMFFLMIVLRDPYLDYMQVSGAIRSEVEAYWQYEKYVVLLVPVNYLMVEMVYSDGDGLLSLISNLIMVVGNILQSVFLCLRMGISGVSLGTTVGMFLATLTLCLHFFRKTNTMHFRWHLSLRDILEMNRLAMTDAVTYICWSLLGIILNKLVISQYGESCLVVLTIALGVYEFALIFDGIGEAVSPLGEVYLGEKNYAGEKDLLRHAFFVSLAEGAAMTLLLLAAAPVIPKLFDITSSEYIPQCVKAVRIMSFLMPFSAVAYLLTSQFLLVRKITLAVSFAVSQSLLLDAVLCILLSRAFGLSGIWVGLASATALTILLFLGYVRLRYGRNRFPWLLEENELPTLNHSFSLTEEGIMEMRSEAEKFLSCLGVEDRTIRRVMLLIEECGTVTMAENRGKALIAEYSLMLDEDSILLTLRDNGRIFDITEKDADIHDLSSYVLTSLMGKYDDERRYLTTISFNRSLLRIRRSEEI